jgi:hypothetical protein
MFKKLTLLLCFAIPVFCMAQQQLRVTYEYDASGNRTIRKTLTMNAPPQSPSAPQDSTLTDPFNTDELTSLASLQLPNLATEPEFFIEKIARVEIKIFPNPTTEKITLQIAGWEDLQTGMFKLFSLSGQLLQEQPVHSSTTEVSLAGLSRGTYILKVHINHRTEEWKIIKQ